MMACSIITYFSEVSLAPLTLKYLNLLLLCSQTKGESKEKDISFDYPLQKKTVTVTTLCTNNDRRKSFRCDNNMFVGGQSV